MRYRGGEQAQAIEASKKAVALGSENPAALLLNAQLVRDAAGNAAALPLFARAFRLEPSWRELTPRLRAAGLLPDDGALVERITAAMK